MSAIWPTFTKENPCPMCGHWDWVCRAGSYMLICSRVESGKPCKGGGWYHHYSGGYKPPVNLSSNHAPTRRIDAFSILRRYQQQTTQIQLEQLASSLGVNLDSLRWLRAAYSTEHRAWAFPMSDGVGNVVGIRLRSYNGFKWTVTGSRQGIFLPYFGENDDYMPWAENTHHLAFLPEGPTDTAALLSLGLYAIGRPNCMAGGEQLKEMLSRLSIRKVVIVVDNDAIKANDKRPGIIGANALRKFLGLRSVMWSPPGMIKDVREYVRKGGARELIESQIKKMVWTK